MQCMSVVTLFNDSMLNTIGEDDLTDVVDEFSDLASRCKNFGTALGIRAADIKKIEQDYRDSDTRLSEIILLCLMKQYNVDKFGPPSWKKFVKAAEKFNRALAKRVAERHPGI